MVGPLQLEDLPLRQLAREHDPFENLFIPRSGTQRRGAPRLAWHAPLGTSAARPLSRSKARMVSFPTHAAYVLVFHDRICCLGDRCACRRGAPVGTLAPLLARPLVCVCSLFSLMSLWYVMEARCLRAVWALVVAMSVDDIAVVALAGSISARASLLLEDSPDRTWECS